MDLKKDTKGGLTYGMKSLCEKDKCDNAYRAGDNAMAN